MKIMITENQRQKRLMITAVIGVLLALCVGGVWAQSELGTFTDPRDGQVYRTVRMPDGKTWMAQNLNYRNPAWAKNDVEGEVAVGDKGSWCYNNSADSCKKYGRLYTWNAAMEACPAGWRLPDTSDWDALERSVGDDIIVGTKLKARDGWTKYPQHHVSDVIVVGTDNYGFSALPGSCHLYNDAFHSAGNCGSWWTISEDGDEWLARSRYMMYYSENVGRDSNFKDKNCSVRCVFGD